MITGCKFNHLTNYTRNEVSFCHYSHCRCRIFYGYIISILKRQAYIHTQINVVKVGVYNKIFEAGLKGQVGTTHLVGICVTE